MHHIIYPSNLLHLPLIQYIDRRRYSTYLCKIDLHNHMDERYKEIRRESLAEGGAKSWCFAVTSGGLCPIMDVHRLNDDNECMVELRSDVIPIKYTYLFSQ